MQLNVVYNPDEFRQLEKEWEALSGELTGETSVYASFSWHLTWWQHYAAQATLHLVVVREGGKLVGIAPLMRRRVKLHGVPATVLCFMENNLSLHNDFLVLPSARAPFFRELLRHLDQQAGQWDAIVLRNLPEHSPNRQLLTELLAGSRRRWRQHPAWTDSPYLVPSGSWDEYLASRSTRTRKALRNIRNSMRKAGDPQVRHIRTVDDFARVREEFFSVTRQAWAGNCGDPLSTQHSEAFYLDLVEAAAARGWLSAWTLELDGRTIAVEFHLRGYGKEHAMRGHYLPEFASLSPGTYLEMEILRQIFEEPQRPSRYDFGGYFENYKRKWTDNSVRHFDLQLYNGRLRSRLVGFHETVAVPLLRQLAPADFWNNRFFRMCGINTKRIG